MRMRWQIAAAALALFCVRCSSDSFGPKFVASEPVTLQEVQDAVFTPRCAVTGCHVGSEAPFGLDLSEGVAYGNLRGVVSAEMPAHERVTPGEPEDSYVFMKVTGDPRIEGDRMPAEGGYLSDSQIELIADWIADGANP